ncbi:hypothetical protein K438DRAFT_1774340 [Mycena galopus ATCC 62051]|nr:hypothetical protein K438DRAFT_1774340 [Mycena galopus ATCC 62051]
MSAPSHNRHPKDEEPIDFWKHIWELTPNQFKNARLLASIQVHNLPPKQTSNALSSMVPCLARSVKLGLPHVHRSYYPMFLKSLHAGLRVAVQFCAADSPELSKVHWLEDTFPRGKVHPRPQVASVPSVDFSSQYPSGVLDNEIESFEILPVDQSLVLPSSYVFSKPRASVVPPSAPSATLAPPSSVSRPSVKKDKKKAKEDKCRDSERKPRSGDDDSDGLDLVTPAADVAREAAKVKTVQVPLSDFPAGSAVHRQKATGGRPQSLPTPKMMMTTKLNTGGQSHKRPADDHAPAEAPTKKKSRQAAPKTPATIEDSDGDIVEGTSSQALGEGQEEGLGVPHHRQEAAHRGYKEEQRPLLEDREAMAENPPAGRDEAVPVVRTISLAEHLQLQSKPQHADSWALDNPIFPKAKMADVIAALPKYNKERLPLDKKGVYFTLMDPAAPPASAVAASATRSASHCSASNAAPAMAPTVATSLSATSSTTTSRRTSSYWRDQMRELEASSLQVEMADRARQLALNNHHFNILQLLHAIVCARRSITCQEFVSHFAGDTPEMQDFNGEYFLRLAMLQGVRADVEVTREWSWHFYRPMDLAKPIPAFGSAYDFYNALEDTTNPQRPLAFYMVPANPEADIPPVWVPLEVDDFEVTISGGTKISCGTNGKRVRDRFYQKMFTALGVKIPEHLLLMDNEASGRIPSLEELGHLGSLYSFDVPPIGSYTGKIAKTPPAGPSSSKTATSSRSPPAPLESDEPKGGSGSEEGSDTPARKSRRLKPPMEEFSDVGSQPADQQDDGQDFDMADADGEGDEDDLDLSTMLGGTGGLVFDDVSPLDAALSGKKSAA